MRVAGLASITLTSLTTAVADDGPRRFASVRISISADFPLLQG
jgi:hypothetical protein